MLSKKVSTYTHYKYRWDFIKHDDSPSQVSLHVMHAVQFTETIQLVSYTVPHVI